MVRGEVRGTRDNVVPIQGRWHINGSKRPVHCLYFLAWQDKQGLEIKKKNHFRQQAHKDSIHPLAKTNDLQNDLPKNLKSVSNRTFQDVDLLQELTHLICQFQLLLKLGCF
jgi:hypothetical protein